MVILQTKVFIFSLLTSFIIIGLVFLVFSSTIFIISTILLILAGFIIFFPRFGFYLFILTITTETLNIFFYTDKYYSIYPIYVFVLLLTILGFALSFNSNGTWTLFSPALSLLAVLLIFLEVQALLWTPNTAIGFHHLIMLTVNIMIFILVVQYVTEVKSLDLLLDMLIVTGIVTASFLFVTAYYDGIEKVFIGKKYGYNYGLLKEGERLAGLGGANQIGGFLSSVVLLILCKLMIASSQIKKLYYFVCGLYTTLAMVMTSSRGSMVGLIAGVMAFILLHRKGRIKFIALMTVFFMTISVLILIAKPQLIDRLLVGFGYEGKLFFSEGEKGKISSADKLTGSGLDVRMQWWKAGLEEAMKEPYKILLGLGPGGFVYYTKAPEVHSFFFSIFFDIGLFGIIILMFFIYIICQNIRQCFQLVSSGSTLYPMLIATTSIVIGEICVHGLVEYEMTSTLGRFPWLYLALNLAVVNTVFRFYKMDQKPTFSDPGVRRYFTSSHV